MTLSPANGLADASCAAFTPSITQSCAKSPVEPVRNAIWRLSGCTETALILLKGRFNLIDFPESTVVAQIALCPLALSAVEGARRE